MSFIVTGRDIPANCFRCPLDKGVWKQEQDPFILCRYTKEIVRYDDVPTDRRLPCCGLKEMPEKHGRLIDADAFKTMCREAVEDIRDEVFLPQDIEKVRALSEVTENLCLDLDEAPTIIEAED